MLNPHIFFLENRLVHSVSSEWLQGRGCQKSWCKETRELNIMALICSRGYGMVRAAFLNRGVVTICVIMGGDRAGTRGSRGI